MLSVWRGRLRTARAAASTILPAGRDCPATHRRPAPPQATRHRGCRGREMVVVVQLFFAAAVPPASPSENVLGLHHQAASIPQALRAHPRRRTHDTSARSRSLQHDRGGRHEACRWRRRPSSGGAPRRPTSAATQARRTAGLPRRSWSAWPAAVPPSGTMLWWASPRAVEAYRGIFVPCIASMTAPQRLSAFRDQEQQTPAGWGCSLPGTPREIGTRSRRYRCRAIPR
mmetsp:Transcript_27242/g.71438  ORF Transcript_27242/g.71438 Transcript_27242/m.71438 type:complete len:228 (-) Transcript_27242:205-888(-)